VRAREGQASAKQVRAALAEYLAECAQEGVQPPEETHQYYRLIEDRMGLRLSSLKPWHEQNAREKLRVQILRELNLLAAQGVLVKRGSQRDLRFLTPAAAKSADEHDTAVRKHLAAETRRTRNVMRQLETVGITPLQDSSGSVFLSLDDWEILIRLAEKGTQQ
jgi:hypothetical protein